MWKIIVKWFDKCWTLGNCIRAWGCSESLNLSPTFEKTHFTNEQCSIKLIHFSILSSKTSRVKYRSSRPEVSLRKVVLKICSKFTGEHPCRSAICNFIEIALRHGCSPVNLLHVFEAPFRKNTAGGLLLSDFIVIKSVL